MEQAGHETEEMIQRQRKMLTEKNVQLDIEINNTEMRTQEILQSLHETSLRIGVVNSQAKEVDQKFGDILGAFGNVSLHEMEHMISSSNMTAQEKRARRRNDGKSNGSWSKSPRKLLSA